MRLRLAHTLGLVLLAFTGVAVLVLGGLSAWHLRNGFGDYLAARDVQHLERFVSLLEARLAQEGGPAPLLAGRMSLHELLGELNPRHDSPPPTPGVFERAPVPGHNPDDFAGRVVVLAPSGAVLLGHIPTRVPDDEAVVERPVHASGQVVALARMRVAPAVHTGAEARFLSDQYVLIASAGLGLMLLALFVAMVLARRWAHTLTAIQEATQRLAQGELSTRLADTPALAGRSDEIGDVVRNVNRMAEGLQQLEGARRRWLADISHELRTPLTVLRGDIEALHDGIRPLRPQAIAVLHEEVLRLNRLVDDLHLLAISDLQALPCHMADDDAVRLLQQVVGRYDSRARAAGLSLHLELAHELPALPVQWDAGRMEQLLVNLLENSLRYTDAPGQVLVQLTHTDSRVRVVVQDSAPGVPDGALTQLFEPLYRADAARSAGGSGLGLAICHAIAETHGAHLQASASTLGGLCLTLDMPRAASHLNGAPRHLPDRSSS